ncbi:DMT family transporter [Streptomyces sp. NPDC004752]
MLGGLGVLAFSLSLPANKIAVTGIDAVGITMWRAAIAGVLAGVHLLAVRAPVPRGAAAARLAVSGLGVVGGFPLLSSLALQSIDSGRAAVILGLLPAVTAMFAQVIGDERLSAGFWAASLAGIAVLTTYLVLTRPGAATTGFGWGDLAMLGATVCSGFGYALGAGEAKSIGGARSISWTLVLLLPLSIPAACIASLTDTYDLRPSVILGMAYIAVVSQLLGFFAWYGGLARGGIGRVGQIQQVQPILTLVASAALLGEPLAADTYLVGVAIAALVWLAQRTRATATPAASRPGLPPPYVVPDELDRESNRS